MIDVDDNQRRPQHTRYPPLTDYADAITMSGQLMGAFNDLASLNEGTRLGAAEVLLNIVTASQRSAQGVLLVFASGF